MTTSTMAMRLSEMPDVRLKMGECEHCGEVLNADARTVSKRCSACGLMSRTVRHPSLNSADVPLAVAVAQRNQPTQEIPMSAPPTPHLDALMHKYGAGVAAAPSSAAPASVDDAIRALGGDPAKLRKDLIAQGMKPEAIERQLAAIVPVSAAPAPTTLSSAASAHTSDEIDRAILMAGGDPAKVRRDLRAAGLSDERIHKQLAAMVR